MQLIDGASVWTGGEIRPEEYVVDLSGTCLE
jgi:hypothetical protein